MGAAPTPPSQGASLLERETRAGVLVLTLAVPRIDEANADRLTVALAEAASAIPQARVVLNLERVGHLSSAALGLFIAYQQRLVREGGKLRLCGLQPPIAQIFRVTKLVRAFDIRPDLKSALEAF